MEKKHRRIPYGTMNWAEIVRECHFVDNTAYFRALESCKTPDAETVEQAVRYRTSLVKRPGWVAPVETAFVEICGNVGYRWFDVA